MANGIQFLRAIATATLICALLVGSGASAAERPIRIVDTEIENTIRLYAAPVFRAAGLDPASVRIHLIRTDATNAFVAGGQQIFLTTGLLLAAEHPGQVIGVLAHETGHIAGGHLARLEGVMRDAATPALLSNVLAAVVGVLSGNPAAAIAIGSGGNHIITRNLLNYSRVQERSADRAAVEFLDETRQSSRGLLEFLNILDDQQVLIVSRRDQQRVSYDVTHPLTRDRIAYIEQHVGASQFSDVPVHPKLVAMHDRMIAKLAGFINPPGQTLRHYKRGDRSIPARYARAVAYYRQPDLDHALPLVEGLIDERPKDPYFHELRGQILFENGRLAEALSAYEAAVRHLPNAPLLRVSLAHVQIELNRPELMKPALANLNQALRIDRSIPLAWRLAATAYGRDGRLGMSALASAEYNYLIGRRADARGMAERAQRRLKRGSPGWLRAEDIRQQTRKKRKKK